MKYLHAPSKKNRKKIEYIKVIFISFNKIRIFMYFKSREKEVDMSGNFIHEKMLGGSWLLNILKGFIYYSISMLYMCVNACMCVVCMCGKSV